MGSKASAVFAAAALLLIASASANRVVLQEQPQGGMPAGQGAMPAAGAMPVQQPAPEFPPAPPQCQKKWEAGKITCQLECPTGRWDLNCDAKTPANAQTAIASCNVFRQSGEANEKIYFLCLVPTPNTVRLILVCIRRENHRNCLMLSIAEFPFAGVCFSLTFVQRVVGINDVFFFCDLSHR